MRNSGELYVKIAIVSSIVRKREDLIIDYIDPILSKVLQEREENQLNECRKLRLAFIYAEEIKYSIL